MPMKRRPSLHECAMLTLCCSLCLMIFLKVIAIEGDELWMRWVSDTVAALRQALR